MSNFSVTYRPITPHEFETLKIIMRGVDWPEHYVDVHAIAAQKYTQDDEGEVYVATNKDEIIGFVTMKHMKINFLTSVFTLVVAKAHHRKGVGKSLIDFAEQRARACGNRGVFLDTTDNNTDARNFYKAIGFQEAYIMPAYYSDERDGITYLKLFNKKI